MNIDKYLERIKYEGDVIVNSETLNKLHRSHVFAIPFEDLDIHQNRLIELDLATIYPKVILKNRGGFCYELNFLFYSLLQTIGFECHLVSSRIYTEDGILGPAFDHMSIVVNLDAPWLVDVGYGDLFIEPIKIKDGHCKKDWFKTYRINKLSKISYLLSESRNGLDFKKRYEFEDKPRQIEEFAEQCEWKQYSKDSYFVKNKICTLPRRGGRTTLFNHKLIQRMDGVKEEYAIQSEVEYDQILKEEFDIEIKS